MNMTTTPKSSRGLTLIELLVVIMILGLIMILAIPRLRMINEDRSVREAARTVGSVFAKASQRAYSDGVAGVCIELNPNISDVDGVQYAGTALFMLRKLPPYVGDDGGMSSLATKTGPNSVVIALPYLYKNKVVQVNDYISFNNSPLNYQIQSTTPDTVNNQLAINLYPSNILPPLPGNNGDRYPFVVHRQPKLQESSRVQLPEGYIIDMRFSGEMRSGAAPLPVSLNHFPMRSYFHEQVPPASLPLKRNYDTRILFGEDGSIDRYQVPITNLTLAPKGDLYFFITRYESKLEREQINSPAKASSEPDSLDSPTNMWLIVDSQTGTSTLSYNVPPGTAVTDLPSRIAAARSIASTGQMAAD
jgi:prepilin-type N-terminal cleavage/methylation domain-containing protein